MAPLPPFPELVPFNEGARVLAEAFAMAGRGAARMIPASGRHLAAALDAAGFLIKRKPPNRAHLTL